ncbi:arginine--tRNA ligase [Pedomonas sp. V897]|uniref:arginine--tRNA ligase n=1 Tax=Pedomonas sp. V897 TaxID=3446482 RepID=UPI003EE154F6
MNVFHVFEERLKSALAALAESGDLPQGLDFKAVTVEPPRDPSHGDLATNAALVLAKPAGKPPRAIAEALAARVRQDPDVETVEVAGPGFLNLRLKASFWTAQVAEILKAGEAYGRSAIGQGQPINVEYVSANPTGPMHVGHCRGAVVGDALANLLQWAGYKVTKEYYINDAGGQVDTLARSAHLRYQQAAGRDIGEIPEGFYPGDYLVPVGQKLFETYGEQYLDAPESEWLQLFKKEATDQMMAMIREDLALLGIHHDVFYSERSLHEDGSIARTLADMEAAGLVYVGTLEKPKGEAAEDWEPRPQTLFRASAFGDDSDRALKKSNGAWTYFAADIAYHKTKVERGFTQLIDIWGADHGGYVKRMQAAVKAISGGKVPLDVKLCQMVRLFKNGEPYKMSKRAGSFVTLADVVREVGRDVVRFMMLTRRADAQLDFDFAKVLEQSRENPVFYVQYAHARICSVMRKAQDAGLPVTGLEAVPAAQLARLTAPEEAALIQLACQWPRQVEAAAQAHEPHRIAFYLYDLAAAFHGLWNRGNDDPSLRFIVDDAELSRARLALIQAVAQVIRNGLAIMGVEPVEEMH